MKPKLLRDCGYETNKTPKIQKKHNEDSKVAAEAWKKEQEGKNSPIHLVTPVINISYLLFDY